MMSMIPPFYPTSTPADVIVLIFIAVLGLCVGSFLTVVIHRLPTMMQYEWQNDLFEFFQQQKTNKNIYILEQPTKPPSWCFARSRCPHCQKTLFWYDNLPLFGFIIQKAKCRQCQQPISFIYPCVELITMLFSVLAIAWFGLGIQGILVLIFTWLLIALSGIDLKCQLLPDRLVLPLGMLGLTANAWSVFVSPSEAILGAAFGFISLWLINVIFRLIRGYDGMGLGDAKLFCALGAWVGASALPMLIFIAASLGVVAGVILQQKNRAFAFGPYLAIAGIIMLYLGDAWLSYFFM